MTQQQFDTRRGACAARGRKSGHAVGVGVIGVRAVLQQRARRLHASVTRGVPEGCAPGLIDSLGRRSCGEEFLEQLHLARLRNDDQGTAALGVAGVDVRVRREQPAHDRRVPALRGRDNRRLRVLGPPVRGCAVGQHRGHHVFAATERRLEQCRVPARSAAAGWAPATSSCSTPGRFPL